STVKMTGVGLLMVLAAVIRRRIRNSEFTDGTVRSTAKFHISPSRLPRSRNGGDQHREIAQDRWTRKSTVTAEPAGSELRSRGSAVAAGAGCAPWPRFLTCLRPHAEKLLWPNS